ADSAREDGLPSIERSNQLGQIHGPASRQPDLFGLRILEQAADRLDVVSNAEPVYDKRVDLACRRVGDRTPRPLRCKPKRQAEVPTLQNVCIELTSRGAAPLGGHQDLRLVDCQYGSWRSECQRSFKLGSNLRLLWAQRESSPDVASCHSVGLQFADEDR